MARRKEGATDGQLNCSDLEGLAQLREAQKPVTLFRWNPETSEWADSKPPQDSKASHPQPPLCIATYNIWFDEVHRRARFDAMLDIVLPRGVDPASWPHFVALQEVVAETAAWLFEDSRIRDHYLVTDSHRTIAEIFYGCVSLVSPLVHPTFATYASFGAPLLTDTGKIMPGCSNMGRGLLSVNTATGLSLGNVHLESPTPWGILSATRRAQLQLCSALLGESVAEHEGGQWYLSGDFNLCSDGENSSISAAGGVDLWSELRPHDLGLTFDCHNNANIREKYASRPDRVVAQCIESGPPVEGSIQRLGLDVIDGISRQPSDHFGLLATVTPRK